MSGGSTEHTTTTSRYMPGENALMDCLDLQKIRVWYKPGKCIDGRLGPIVNTYMAYTSSLCNIDINKGTNKGQTEFERHQLLMYFNIILWPPSRWRTVCGVAFATLYTSPCIHIFTVLCTTSFQSVQVSRRGSGWNRSKKYVKCCPTNAIKSHMWIAFIML